MFSPLSRSMSSASFSVILLAERSRKNTPVPLGLPKFKRGGIRKELHYIMYNDNPFESYGTYITFALHLHNESTYYRTLADEAQHTLDEFGVKDMIMHYPQLKEF